MFPLALTFGSPLEDLKLNCARMPRSPIFRCQAPTIGSLIADIHDTIARYLVYKSLPVEGVFDIATAF